MPVTIEIYLSQCCHQCDATWQHTQATLAYHASRLLALYASRLLALYAHKLLKAHVKKSLGAVQVKLIHYTSVTSHICDSMHRMHA
jgi:hypothetical protein